MLGIQLVKSVFSDWLWAMVVFVDRLTILDDRTIFVGIAFRRHLMLIHFVLEKKTFKIIKIETNGKKSEEKKFQKKKKSKFVFSKDKKFKRKIKSKEKNSK